MNSFETRISTKGQIVIIKQIREELGLKPNQKLIERRVGNKIVIEPVLPLHKVGGILKNMDKRSTKEILNEIKRGWE